MRIISDLYKNEFKTMYTNNRFIDDFRDKSILIIGGSGLLGTFFVDFIMFINSEYKMNIKLVTTGRNISRANQLFHNYFDNKNFTFIQNDITEKFPTLDFDIDYVIMAASNTHPLAYANDPIGTILTNVVGTKNILDFMVENKSERLLFLSSVEIYGIRESDTPFVENEMGYIDSNSLRGGYPESKRVSESLCQAYKSKYDIDFIVGRLCRIYGPTVLNTDSKVITQFLKKGINNDKIVLKSKGNQYFSFLHVADAVIAILMLLNRGTKGEAYNISDTCSDIKLKDLAELIANISGTEVKFELPNEKEKIGFSKAINALLDSSKLKLLGWNAQYNIKNGIKKTLMMLKENDEMSEKNGK